MIALVQRVAAARVEVGGETVGAIDAGLLVLVCAEPADTHLQCAKLLDKLLALRIFADERGRMNRSLRDVGGGLLLVSQFTLAADTSSGNRPGFSAAAAPQVARPLFDELVVRARQRHTPVAAGVFGAHMQLHLVNDGPVTVPLRIA